MIIGKDKAWHYKKCIQMWEEITENDLDDKMRSYLVLTYAPQHDCFEAY